MENEWFARKYEEGDEHGICELMNNVYGSWYNEDYWRWKYRDNPRGFLSSNVLIAECNGKIVGTFAVIPVKIKFWNNNITSSQAIDLAVHPDYKRLKIFKTLAKKLYAYAGKNAMHITFALPPVETDRRRTTAYKGAAYLGHMKMGWKHVSFLSSMIKVLNIENVLYGYSEKGFLRKKSRFLKQLYLKIFCKTPPPLDIHGLKVTKISSFDNRVNNFWQNISGEFELGVVRDREFLNWRYVSNPSEEYTIYIAESMSEIVGYLISKCRTRGNLIVGEIVDILVLRNQRDIIHNLILKSIEHFENKNVDIVYCTMLRKKMYFNTLKKIGFIPRISKAALIVRTNSNKLSATDVSNHKNWYFTMGDTDSI